MLEPEGWEMLVPNGWQWGKPVADAQISAGKPQFPGLIEAALSIPFALVFF